MPRAAIVTGRVLVATYAAICTLFFFIQRSIIFHPVAASGDASGTTFEVPGAVLRIAARPHDGPRAILYFGGNAEDVSWAAADLAGAFPDRAIYAVHYRGYGGSTGRPTEQALHADAAAVFADVQTRHPEVDVIGRSLGSAVATRLAATQPVRRLVLVTPFDSILALARRMVPFLPMRLLLADRFESVRDAPQVAIPTLVITAGADEIVPHGHTARLVAAFRPGLVVDRDFPGTGHNGVSASPTYLEAIAEFLR
ncbi:MAG: alpha/beta hydrolase [Planctomycetaceae bacterium]